MNNLPTNLRMLRAERNLTCVQLSHELNINDRRISDIEHSKSRHIAIRPDEIGEIAKYFNIDTETLLYKKAYVAFK